MLWPVRKGLTFADGVPKAYEDLLLETWMPSSFFLELAVKWAVPHTRHDLWRAISIAQFLGPRKHVKEEGAKALPTFPLIQAFWIKDQGTNLYFIRLHPALSNGPYWVEKGRGTGSKHKVSKAR